MWRIVSNINLIIFLQLTTYIHQAGAVSSMPSADLSDSLQLLCCCLFTALLTNVLCWQAAVPVADGGDVGAAGYEAALDGLEALRAVLRDEHSLLTQYKMIVWGRVFTPVQVHILRCWCLL